MKNAINFFWKIFDTLSDFKNFLIYPSFKKTKITCGGFVAIFIIIVANTLFEGNYLENLYSLFPQTEESYIVESAITNGLTIQQVLIQLFLGPIIEEICFRGWMSKNKYLGLFLVAGSANLFLTIFVLPFVVYYNDLELNSLSQKILEYTSLAVCYFLSYLIIGERKERLSSFISKNSGVLFYFSCIVFAVMHIVNYDEGVSGRLMLLSQVPIFTSALIFGYLRARFGMVYSIGYHFIANSLALAYEIFG
jgi:membrane protease YdiL (CAAX protease family)